MPDKVKKNRGEKKSFIAVAAKYQSANLLNKREKSSSVRNAVIVLWPILRLSKYIGAPKLCSRRKKPFKPFLFLQTKNLSVTCKFKNN
jgi:hypothetical protein